MDVIEVIGDRFARVDRDRAVDLATGDGVLLRVGLAGGESDERRWMARCDLLHRLQHPALARLVDYGAFGERQRFEAWRCGPAWRGAREEETRVTRAVASMFEAGHLGIGVPGVGHVHEHRGRAVVVPDAESGSQSAISASAASHPRLEVERHAILIRNPPAMRVLAELFSPPVRPGPHVVGIWGASGSGKTTLAGELARVARREGFVPFAARLLDSSLAQAVVGRSVLLIDDEEDVGWERAVDLACRSTRVHVVLFVGREDRPGVPGSTLEPFTAEALLETVWPAVPGDDPRWRQRAERARGSLARFGALMWSELAPFGSCSTRPSRVAEARGVYNAGVAGVRGSRSNQHAVGWPAPGELGLERLRMSAAVAQLGAGRHATGARAVRQAIGRLSRRGDWSSAADGALALALAMLDRGRTLDAKHVAAQAHEYLRNANRPATLVAIALGRAAIEEARLDEAEHLLRTAFAAARAADDWQSVASASLALARCLFWSGRYDEAAAVLPSPKSIASEERIVVYALALRARVAIGRSEWQEALSCVSDASVRADRMGSVRLAIEAALAGAFVALAIGDAGALARQVATCLEAARYSRHPLAAVRARLIEGEWARRTGRRADAAAIAARLARIKASALPPLLRERRALLADLLSGPKASEDVVHRRIAVSGVAALRLFVPSERPRPSGSGSPAMIEDVVDILQICHSAEDERAAMTGITERLMRRLQAASVGFFVPERASCTLLLGAGVALDPEVAARAVLGAMTIAPHRLAERVECAVPVRYAGSVVGALAARWPIGASPDAMPTVALMNATAVAAAPLVAALAAHRQRPAGPPSELLGTGAAMGDLRAAIERAARAPFAVLIEGESGSGKELVARALHRLGVRPTGPFCTLNCAAVPDDLIESELFGHARGAFTGAVAERPGVFEDAHGGTLFLDEVGELSPRAQAKLLRVIQEGELRRIGENVSRRIDVRVVSATNRDLREEVAGGRFRLDLRYRLDVIRLAVPPLRDRREDIPVLAEHFWRDAAARVGSKATLTAATLAALAQYDWPGNVRELQNVVAALAVRCGKRGFVTPSSLPSMFADRRSVDSWRLDDARRTFDERFVRAALVRAGGRRTQAAAELGISRQGLAKLMVRLGIT